MVGVATATKTLSTIARFRRLCTSLKTNSQSGYTLFTSLPREHAMHCNSCGNISKCLAKSLFTLERKHTSQTLLYFKFWDLYPSNPLHEWLQVSICIRSCTDLFEVQVSLVGRQEPRVPVVAAPERWPLLGIFCRQYIRTIYVLNVKSLLKLEMSH